MKGYPGPLTDLNLFIKGEPPISSKFNAFTTNYSTDINIIAKQLDYLAATIISSNNIFAAEVEQENNFINRIKSKMKILQMYSSGPSNDLYYLGDSFDSADYVDFSRTENKDKIPVIENGKLFLGVTNLNKWVPRSIILQQESNGTLGSNHTVYSSAGYELNYKYHFIDNPTSRNINHIQDNNPITFFEYEQINVLNKSTQSKSFEYKYKVDSGPNIPTSYKDWSSFESNSLNLVITLESETAAKANYVNIVPYFGTTDSNSKDVIVHKIEVINELDQVENILPKPIFISSTFIPSSIDSIKNSYYKEAKITFLERKVKKINIHFQQLDHSEVKIKHVYFRPDPVLATNTPYANQLRFSPEEPTVVPSMGYPLIPWSNIVYNVSELIPQINQPNLFKSEVYNTKTIDVSLSRNTPSRTGFCVKVKGLDGSFYRITTRFFDNFNNGSERLVGYSAINDTNYREFISSANVNSNGGYLDPYISSINSSNLLSTPDSGTTNLLSDINEMVSWFNTSNLDGTSAQKYEKFKLDPTFAAVREETDSFDTKTETKRYRVQLIREFEILNAQRKSISLRDIDVGYETYLDTAEVISRRYDVPSEIEYITISAESDFSGQSQASSSEHIKYYVSVDDGKNWIPIASIEDPFSNIPEVIAFNLNIDRNFRIPGVSYYNQPDVPSTIKSFLVKIELTRPKGTNITPVVYSYKVGTKVKQL